MSGQEAGVTVLKGLRTVIYRAGDLSKAKAWGVENADAALKKLLDLGATPHRQVQDVGGGIRVASVRDSSGNILGIIENPHFKISAQG